MCTCGALLAWDVMTRTASQVNRKIGTTNGGNVAIYTSSGSGAPVFFIHGNSLSASIFDYLLNSNGTRVRASSTTKRPNVCIDCVCVCASFLPSFLPSKWR